MLHLKCRKQLPVVYENGEDIKHQSGGEDRNHDRFQYMLFLVMPHLMGEDRDKLVLCLFFNEGVKKDNPSEFAKSGEEGIRLGGAF